jgi:uncharacterized protein (TIGR00251 family)
VARIGIRLQPRASSSGITGERGGRITVRVTAPPVDGKANDALVRLVAKRLGVARSRVSIVRGQSSRDKLLEIDGIDEGQARTRLLGDD